MQRPSTEGNQRTPRRRKRADGPIALPDAWKRLLGQAGTPASRNADRGQLGFFFEIATSETAAAQLETAPVVLFAQPDKRPRVQPLDTRRLTHAGLAAPEQRLASSLLGLPHSQRKGRNYAQLSGHVGDALLREMLDTAPCFLGGVAGLRLARGKPREFVWRWQLERDGRQRLLPDLPHGVRALRVGALWCLDAEHAELSLLESAPEELGLIDAPALEPDQAEALARSLADSPLAGRIPEPLTLGSAQQADFSPQPVLHLNALSRHARMAAGTPPLAYARLGFDYGGEHLPGRGGEALVRVVRDGKLLEIVRRRAEELAAMERLEGMALTPAVDCEGLPWDLTETLPEDAWLFPGTGHTGALEVNTPARWLALRPRLEQEGFTFDYAPSFPFEVLDGPVRWYGKAESVRGGDSFDFEIGVELDGERFNLLPALAQALAEEQFSLSPTANEPEDAVWYAPLDARRRVPLDLKRVRQLLAPLAEYLEKPRERLRLPRVQAGRLEEFAESLPKGGSLEAPPKLKSFASRLGEAAQHSSDKPPKALKTRLRGYQREGLRWLNALAEAGLGGVLADDMGLGKTVQLLAHLLALKQEGSLKAPALVVAPTSLMPNWESEAARFAPDLKCLLLHGPQRGEHFERIAEHDLVLTSYALLPRDLDELKQKRFSLLALDEAQQVKNPRTLARRAIVQIKAPRRLCLSGTPLENHLGELWSQLDLAVPGLLGDERAFRRHYRVPIEKRGDPECQERLNRRVAPFILRRSKSQVARELPPKSEITRRVVLEASQRALYDSLRLSLSDELREVIAQRGIEQSGIAVLDALLKLRQVCCDPRLVKLEAARGVRESAKFELLMDMLPALVSEGRRILLFSQFTGMLALIAKELTRRRMRYVLLTGETRDRAEPVRRFQGAEVPLFLLSLKAGGVGLNLTAADTVIHYDPWWNPAAEAQASDRAHRIGQDKPVFVYRLVCADTVEERIELLKARKAALVDAVLEGGGTRTRVSFSEDDLKALLEDQ